MVTAKAHHGISLQDLSSGNVYSNGVLEHGGIDSHRGMPFDNVFTQLTVKGDGYGGGASSGGPLVGRRQVMWNLIITSVPISGTSSRAIKDERRRHSGLAAMVGAQQSVMGALIGIRGADPQPQAKSWAMPPGDKGTITGEWGAVLAIPNIYEAQRTWWRSQR